MITTKKSGGLLAATLLINSLTAFAGDTTALSTTDGKDAKAVIEKKADSNPLSLLGGKIVFDVQERVRWEIRDNNFDFDRAHNTLNDDNWFLQRFRIGVAVQPVAWLKFYVQGQDSREINSNRPDFPGAFGAEGDDAFDLRQGYLMLGSDKAAVPLTLTLGRQILAYGDERLVGSFDWNNLGRTFDAAKLRLNYSDWSLDAFASTVAIPTRGKYNQSDLLNGTETERGEVFAGLYYSSKQVKPLTIDLYAFYKHDHATPQDTNFVTFGTRIVTTPGKSHGWDAGLETAGQLGKVNGKNLKTYAAHIGGGYTFESLWSKPRLGAEYNYASGDSDPTDGDVETFQNLFPTNHKFYGYADFFSWQNLHNPALSVSCTPIAKVKLQADYHAFWLATTDDSWYRANGVTTVRPITRNADNFVGTELDLTATYTPFQQLGFQVGYSHFFAGDYLAASGPNSDADFGYAMTTISF